MKGIVTCLFVCLCVVCVSGLGIMPCGAQVGGEIMQPGIAGPAPLGGPMEVEAPAWVQFAPGANVWIEAVFIEMDRGITRDFEEGIGFKLSPPDGKAILSAEEKEKILSFVEELEEARILASLTVLTIAGQQAQTEQVEEITYPTEYDYKDGTIIPGNWETRDVGGILNVTPIISKDGLITMVLMPEVTVLSEWLEIDGTDVTQPIFKTWNTTTTVHIPDGTAFVLKGAPFVPLHGSQSSNPGEEVAPEDQKTHLVIISAKIVQAK